MAGDILGIGQWQAARVNERSEVLNELNKPFFSTTYRTNNGISTVEITPTHVLFFVMLYFVMDTIGPMFMRWLGNVFESPQDNADGVTGGSIISSFLTSPITQSGSPAAYLAAHPEVYADILKAGSPGLTWLDAVMGAYKEKQK